MNQSLQQLIHQFDEKNITEERKAVLTPLRDYIRQKNLSNEPIRLNFICTHNSRRSHLTQIWAQTMAYHFLKQNLFCYSGGTEATAVFPAVVQTLKAQGFDIMELSETDNPVYAFKFAENEPPIICFSKVFSNAFNPQRYFAAIMTCDHADEACPFVPGAEARFPIRYTDPKAWDGTEVMTEKYHETSLEIGLEMWWVMG